jgi:hypothetical protein
MLNSLTALAVTYFVNAFGKFGADFFYQSLSVISDVMVFAVVLLGIDSDLVQVRKQLPLRPVIVPFNTLFQKAEPHFTANDYAVVLRYILLHAVHEVDQVVLLFAQELL